MTQTSDTADPVSGPSDEGAVQLPLEPSVSGIPEEKAISEEVAEPQLPLVFSAQLQGQHARVRHLLFRVNQRLHLEPDQSALAVSDLRKALSSFLLASRVSREPAASSRESSSTRPSRTRTSQPGRSAEARARANFSKDPRNPQVRRRRS